MVQKLCIHYGPYVGTIEGEPFHDFPGPEALSGDQVEAHLRQLGFGYRARYIAETARIVSSEKPSGWLSQLRNPACPAIGETTTRIKLEPDDTPEDVIKSKQVSNTNPTATPAETAEAEQQQHQASYRTTHEALLTLPGVGPKVSDCVCLMGLGWWEAVPVDTHVWQIAQRDYGFGKGGAKGGKGGGAKTFTKAMHDAVGDHFRGIWGAHAGWAQSVLFTANLKAFAGQAGGGRGASSSGVGDGAGLLDGGSGGGKAVVKMEEAKAAVKVEVREEVAAVVSTAGRTGRKRKVGAAAKESDDNNLHQSAGTDVTVSTRRTSKRLKSASG